MHVDERARFICFQFPVCVCVWLVFSVLICGWFIFFHSSFVCLFAWICKKSNEPVSKSCFLRSHIRIQFAYYFCSWIVCAYCDSERENELDASIFHWLLNFACACILTLTRWSTADMIRLEYLCASLCVCEKSNVHLEMNKKKIQMYATCSLILPSKQNLLATMVW